MGLDEDEEVVDASGQPVPLGRFGRSLDGGPLIPPEPPPTYRRRGSPSFFEDDDLMRVSASSPPQAVASSIRAAIFEEHRLPIVRAIGAGAVAQACKGIAIARGHVAVSGRDLATTIGFETVPGDSGQDISAQVFHLFLR